MLNVKGWIWPNTANALTRSNKLSPEGFPSYLSRAAATARVFSFPAMLYADAMLDQYAETLARITALTEGEHDLISNMATVACELFHSDDRFDWVGFYRVVGPQLLKIGPYQGGHGCLVIPFSRGVCGASATARATIIVPDVDAFPGHIACATSTKSEIVLPVFDAMGKLIAVLDIDSDQPDAFGENDQHALEMLLATVFSR
jgi:L-methionine (R)-S-oxide reductase